jgi:hypothetical protein
LAPVTSNWSAFAFVTMHSSAAPASNVAMQARRIPAQAAAEFPVRLWYFMIP